MFEELKYARVQGFGEPDSVSHTSQSSRSASFVGLRNALPSHVDIVSSFVDQLMRFISRFRGSDESNAEIDLALREALVNAIIHGKRNDPRKRVNVNCRCTRDGEVSITVEDEGNGFRSDTVSDPTLPENKLRTHGRGIYLIRTLMDEVHFEKGGSVIHMRKRANADSESAPSPSRESVPMTYASNSGRQGERDLGQNQREEYL
jgi:serine/threonine-protein kinase RsbW